MDRQQWLSTTQRTYAGATQDQVLTAAERVLRLADEGDFTLSHSPSGLQARRTWSAYLVIAAVFGEDLWQVTATPTTGGTTVHIQVTQASQDMAAAPVGVTTTPGPTHAIQGPALYELFWARLDHLLGARPDWVTCAQQEARVSAGAVWGDLGPLCDTLTTSPRDPDGRPERPRKDGIGIE
jgi:hypothetical protein